MSERSNVLVTGGSGKFIIDTNIKMIRIYKYKYIKATLDHTLFYNYFFQNVIT